MSSVTYKIEQLKLYLRTPRSRVLLENLTGSQLVKESPAFYGTRRITTAFTSARHLSLSWASSIQSMSLHPTSWRSILILSSHLHLWSFTRSLSLRYPYQKPVYTYPFPVRAACPAHHYSYTQNTYRSSLPGRKQPYVSVKMAWISFGAVSWKKKNLMTARVSMLLKSRASLTCFRASFLPGRAKDLSAPRYQRVTVSTLHLLAFSKVSAAACCNHTSPQRLQRTFG